MNEEVSSFFQPKGLEGTNHHLKPIAEIAPICHIPHLLDASTNVLEKCLISLFFSKIFINTFPLWNTLWANLELYCDATVTCIWLKNRLALLK